MKDLEPLREDIITSFDMIFGGRVASDFLGHNRCPLCGSSVMPERESCRSCGLEFIEGDWGQYEISKEYKEFLFDEQKRLRQKLSPRVRERIHLDEWVYHSADLYKRSPHFPSAKEEVIVVTLKRVFRFNPGKSKRYNWEIPIDKMIGVQTLVEDRHRSGKRPSGWWWSRHSHQPVEYWRSMGDIALFKIFQFDYTSGRGIKSKEGIITLEDYDGYSDRRATRSISKYVHRANKVMKIRKSMGIE
ncbi:MAG: hypothetical protein ACFE7S_06990 [Candidatus Hodarchaeota archaeon]